MQTNSNKKITRDSVDNSIQVSNSTESISSNGSSKKRTIIAENGEVSEVWINTGGYFDTRPVLRSLGMTPFRLPEAGRQELLDEAYRLWKYDPLGGTIVRTTTFFTLGRGLTFQFEDKKAQFYAEKFYKKNSLEVKLRAASDEANAFGEVYIWLRPHFDEVRKNGKVLWRVGDVQVTFIPPDNITYVETADDDLGDVHNFIMEWEDADRSDLSRTIPHISKYNIFGSNRETGCIIQLKLNAGNMDPFGHSDLISVKEWLDNYQEYLRDGVIINKLYRSPCYDISIEDGSEDEINQAIARYKGWTIGSNPVHNSREEWKILEFTGPNSSNEQARRALLLIVAAGVGFAEFMLADGSNSNMASSKSQQLPVVKKFEDRQEIWSYVLGEVMQFVLQTKAALNPQSGLVVELDDEGDPLPFKGSVSFPPIAQDRDIEVAQTNKLALEAGYMSKRTAAARLNLNLHNEIESDLVDSDLLGELNEKMIESGLKVDPASMVKPGNPQPNANDSESEDDEDEPEDEPEDEEGSRPTEVGMTDLRAPRSRAEERDRQRQRES